MSDPSICIAGAGSIGCYVGGMLRAGGRPVSLLARPRVIEDVKTNGLTVTSFNGIEHQLSAAEIRLSDDPSILADADIVLVTVKSDDTPAMAVSRLLLTADGRADMPDRLAGAGDVQVYDALTRPLALDESGAAEQTAPEPDTQVYAAPEPEPDVLASTRHDAVWWGLLGGGALLLALVLRPVLARRAGSRASR